MESEVRREARLSQRRDCDRECCSIESNEHNFPSSEEERIELGVPLSLLLSDRGRCSDKENQ